MGKYKVVKGEDGKYRLVKAKPGEEKEARSNAELAKDAIKDRVKKEQQR